MSECEVLIVPSMSECYGWAEEGSSSGTGWHLGTMKGIQSPK